MILAVALARLLLPAFFGLLVSGGVAWGGETPQAPLRVYADFPGGSAAIQSIDQQNRAVHIKPAAHPGRGWECWWYFKVTGIRPGETITVEVSGMDFALPDQAHFTGFQPGPRRGPGQFHRPR